MKRIFNLLGVLCSVFLMAAVGCSEIDMFSINAPDDLQDRIDAIANNKVDRGDTTTVVISTAIAGAEDCSSGWWTAFSDYFEIPSNKLLHLEFVNHSSKANNWNNWNLCVANGKERDQDGYKEYFVIRADNYGWDGTMSGTDERYKYDAAMLKTDYAEVIGGEDFWSVFREIVDGAKVEMDIDHSSTGVLFVNVKMTCPDGTVLNCEYQNGVSATESVNAFIVCDGSWFEMKDAYLIPSKVTELEDFPAVSIVARGYPSAIEIGGTDVWGEAVATVTFADGTTQEVGLDDITLSVPDLTEVGTKTVVYSYSKTKLGEWGSSVNGYYTIEVTNPVKSLSIISAPTLTTYWYFDETTYKTDINGLEVEVTYMDGSKGIIDNRSLIISDIQASEEGPQDVTVTYAGGTTPVSTTFQVNVKKGTAGVGSLDFTNGWWATFSENVTVEENGSATFRCFLLSDNLMNYHSPCTILRKLDGITEYAVVRMDNFGWGSGYEGTVLESDWNFDTFRFNLNYSDVTITVTHNGNTADVVYDVVYANGEKHTQKYTGITIETELQVALVTEASYLVLHN